MTGSASDVAEIMRRERARTLAAVADLPLPAPVRDDVLTACAALQTAINNMVAELDRVVDQRVAPTAMRLMAEEFERLNRRFVEAGLAARSH